VVFDCSPGHSTSLGLLLSRRGVRVPTATAPADLIISSLGHQRPASTDTIHIRPAPERRACAERPPYAPSPSSRASAIARLLVEISVQRLSIPSSDHGGFPLQTTLPPGDAQVLEASILSTWQRLEIYTPACAVQSRGSRRGVLPPAAIRPRYSANSPPPPVSRIPPPPEADVPPHAGWASGPSTGLACWGRGRSSPRQKMVRPAARSMAPDLARSSNRHCSPQAVRQPAKRVRTPKPTLGTGRRSRSGSGGRGGLASSKRGPGPAGLRTATSLVRP